MADVKLIVRNARQVVQVRKYPILKVCGEGMQQVDISQEEDGDGISVVSNSDGKILFIGKESERKRKYVENETTRIIDASGKCVLPGFVDAHTHPVWAGDRVHEFAMKLAGATYMEVHKAGGGIHYTVEHTQRASEDELYDGLKQRLNSLMKTGTTLVECKSGYGLNKATEVKMLRVIERARRNLPIGISSTFCGAHAVPKGGNSEDATNDVISVQLPCIRDMMEKKELTVDNIDVFCEQGVFDIDQSRRILSAGKNIGLQINFHGDELHPLDGAKMGAELGALAISHLEEISDSGISAMVEAGSIGVVLPTTAYILRLKPPPVRKMIDSGMAVALGSDFNPNAFCSSMPIVMHLACVLLRMSMPEVLIAATLNAAAALGKSDTHGSLIEGKCANMVIIDAPRWEHIIYQFGFQNDLIDFVICEGNVVFEK
ncbi:probable imidazolonepropionase [Pecten maximus]|uniref:probable imidazolonepropionase n=1 Tax=Pecten maximus TaxID=6579 RepID=UPI0014580793|nr:probable imidazolonepropionase [Pecten maximus]